MPTVRMMLVDMHVHACQKPSAKLRDFVPGVVSEIRLPGWHAYILIVLCECINDMFLGDAIHGVCLPVRQYSLRHL